MPIVPAQPYEFTFDVPKTALLIIDMQRDFLEPKGFGESLGNDVSRLRSTIGPTQKVLAVARELSMDIVHTREGHRSDLTDVPMSKMTRGKPKLRIGDKGPMGRLLIRGEPGHQIIPELAPWENEPVIDKPGKGAFYATDLEAILRNRGIRSLIVCGVTTEVCVHTTVREANDRGFDCLVVSDAVGSYFPKLHEAALEMISAQGGIFGWVSSSSEILKVLS